MEITFVLSWEALAFFIPAFIAVGGFIRYIWKRELAFNELRSTVDVLLQAKVEGHDIHVVHDDKFTQMTSEIDKLGSRIATQSGYIKLLLKRADIPFLNLD